MMTVPMAGFFLGAACSVILELWRLPDRDFVSASDVAGFLLKQLNDEQYLDKIPGISD